MSERDQTRVCVIYDCLYPHTRGGAERWYRAVDDGLDVTYLTRRQWDEDPAVPGVEVVAVSGRRELYDDQGNRRIIPALLFGWGVLRWMLRHRRSYDIVHCASFPFFSLLGARLALVGTSVPVVVDYHEVWHQRTWRRYAGPLVGRVGHAVQSLCIRVSHRALVFTPTTAAKLNHYDADLDVEVLPGLLPDDLDRVRARRQPPTSTHLVFVGRHIEDKGVDQLLDIITEVRRDDPRAHLTIVGDGPATASLHEDVRRRGLEGAVDLVGRVDDQRRDALVAGATCLVLPSRREGYGIVVAEASAFATPAVVSDHEENLATDLIDEGVNGFVCEPTPIGTARAVRRVVDGGERLRHSTREWCERAQHRTLAASVTRTLDIYRELRPQPLTRKEHYVTAS